MKYPFILVLEEKHGDYYYLMDCKDDLRAFAIKLLTERFDAGYYYIEPKPVADTFEQYFEDVHNMTLGEAESLIKLGDGVKIGNRTPENEIKSMKTAYVYARAEVEEYGNIVKAVDEKNASMAWRILYNRSGEGYQYERFGMEPIENRVARD